MSIVDLPKDSHPSGTARAPNRLQVVHDDTGIDLAAASRAVADLLVALGQDVTGEHLVDTPERVARTYVELLTPREFQLTTFPNDEGYDELVLARAIPFYGSPDVSVGHHQASRPGSAGQ